MTLFKTLQRKTLQIVKSDKRTDEPASPSKDKENSDRIGENIVWDVRRKGHFRQGIRKNLLYLSEVKTISDKLNQENYYVCPKVEQLRTGHTEMLLWSV